jgi:hypothetical protein
MLLLKKFDCSVEFGIIQELDVGLCHPASFAVFSESGKRGPARKVTPTIGESGPRERFRGAPRHVITTTEQGA